MRRAAAAFASIAFVAGAALAQPARNAADAKRPRRRSPPASRSSSATRPTRRRRSPTRSTTRATSPRRSRRRLQGHPARERFAQADAARHPRVRRPARAQRPRASSTSRATACRCAAATTSLPVDADIAREDEVAFSAMDLAAVLEKMDTARNPLNLVILDACRNNPFATRFQLAAPGPRADRRAGGHAHRLLDGAGLGGLGRRGPQRPVHPAPAARDGEAGRAPSRRCSRACAPRCARSRRASRCRGRARRSSRASRSSRRPRWWPPPKPAASAGKPGAPRGVPWRSRRRPPSRRATRGRIASGTSSPEPSDGPP